ncbi:MAG: type I pullulanase [Blautia sp.]|nr:type I pullulanase [Lachnoclostridium sp.]MCM1211736.1 type I pullulanase [Blautia sp.]
MKRKVSALFMAILLAILPVLVTISDTMTVNAAGELTLKLHYHREDGNYDGWDVWLWPEGGEGAGYPFEEEDGEMVATKEIEPGTASVGFIVRTADWTKDIDADQFIDISEVVSGTVHIYVESGVEGYEKEYADDAVTGTKLKAATYNNDGTITVTMTGAIEGDLNSVFTVAGKESDIAISEVAAADSDFVYTVTLAEELESSKSYHITYEESTYDIYMPSIYSTAEFEDAYTYTGDDLGAVWSASETRFRVWAPTAESMTLNLYETGKAYVKDLTEEIPMTPDVNGTWVATKSGDLNGVYYTYSVEIDGVTRETCDPYARTTGVNGERAMVINLDETDPEGWDSDTNPHAGEAINDAVIYELHVRDLSTNENSGMENTGKFLALTETGTTTSGGVSTGLDHIKELGITHLHLLPIYDFGSVDETHTVGNLFNWGYDPVNYNVPEGSYSTDPFNGEVRVKELKQAVKALHDNGISVVMDVVYNHVQSASSFCFNKLVPDYFSRLDETGAYSNGSGCGNDTASERSMVKKYIVDSVCYWADEYHIDGFRFDLVGLLDTETVNEIVEAVHKDHPDVIFYGEGWTLETSLTKEGYTLATQPNSPSTPGFAYFNDTIRDGLKGSVFDDTDPGYVSGKSDMEELITRCFLGADTWCTSPAQTINYASCHDNQTLYDHLQSSRPDASAEDLVKMNNLAAAVYMMTEGTPFMQAGEEMLRTKVRADGTFDSNSYSSGDAINCLKWADLEDETHAQVYEYYKGLIAFRKAHGALRLSTAEEVSAAVTAVEGLDANVVAFDIQGGSEGESADELFIIFNANPSETTVTLPDGDWNVYINGEKAGTEALETITNGSASVAPISAMALVRESGVTAASSEQSESSDDASDAAATDISSNTGTGLIVGIVAAIVIACGVVFGISLGKKKKEDKK